MERLEPFPESLGVAEYEALHEEIQHRGEQQGQIVGLTLLVAGTFFTVGVQENIPVSVPLVYPILATFLAALWAQNDVYIYLLRTYIRESYEPLMKHHGWETYLGNLPRRQRWRLSLDSNSVRGVFFITQTLSIALAFSHHTFLWLPQQVGLLGLDGFCVAFTLFFPQRFKLR